MAALENKAERDTLPLFDNQLVSEKIKRLCTLTVGNFRGFGVKEVFDFSAQYTFYHGPNGLGKTSFCEAIKYSVLGTVTEASR